MLCILVLLFLKFLHDVIREKREELIERYFDLAGRITALFVGSVAIEMIMAGVKTWLNLHWS
jgi:small neutral amino acid transporter SnatA (MarC family)